MKLGKIKDVLVDWTRGGFHFGKGFSDMMLDRMEASGKTRRFGGLAFDAAAGIGLTWLGVTSLLGNALTILAAPVVFFSAPVTAVVGAAVATVFLCLAPVMTAFGVGFLDAAREKAGLASPKPAVDDAMDKTRALGASLEQGFFKPARNALSRAFTSVKSKAAAPAPKSAEPAPQQKPAPKPPVF